MDVNGGDLNAGGRGINRTLFALGDLLLSKGGKQRTDPESDFVLSHAGYWTDVSCSDSLAPIRFISIRYFLLLKG